MAAAPLGARTSGSAEPLPCRSLPIPAGECAVRFARARRPKPTMRLLAPLLLAIGLAANLAAESSGPSGAPILGVEMSPVPSSVQQQQGLDPNTGVFVRKVFPGTAAADMGLRPGDVVTSINGAPINSMTDLRNVVGAHQVGDQVQVTVRREGADVAAHSTFDQWPVSIPHDPIDQDAEKRFKDWQDRRRGRQAQSVRDLSAEAKRLREALAAGNAEPFTNAPALRQAETLLRFLPAWHFEYDWTTREIQPASGLPSPATPVAMDPWQATVVNSTRYVSL
jgi:hypothetical protein